MSDFNERMAEINRLRAAIEKQRGVDDDNRKAVEAVGGIASEQAMTLVATGIASVLEKGLLEVALAIRQASHDSLQS